MKAHVHLSLLQQLDEVDVIGDNLTKVCHLLKQLGKQLQGVGVVQLQLQLKRMKHRLLQLLDGLHVQQARPVWTGYRDRREKSVTHLTLT